MWRKLFHDGGRPTLLRRILRGIVPVVILSVCAVSLANYFVARQQIASDIRDQIDALATQIARNTQVFVEQRQRDLETLAETRLLDLYHQNREYNLEQEAATNQKDIQTYFSEFATRTRVYEAVLYVGPEGELLVDGKVRGVVKGQKIEEVLPAAGVKFAGLPVAEAAKSDIYRSPVMVKGGKKLITFAKPTWSGEGKLRGFVVLVCDLEYLEQILAQTQVGREGRAYILTPEGEPLLGEKPAKAMDLRKEVEIGSLPWKMVIEATEAEFIEPLIRLRDLTILFSLVVALMVTASVILSTRRATRPIADMVAGTHKLAEGDLSHRLALPPIRELETLAIGFNDMAGKLKIRNEELESRIRQLTALRRMEGTVIQRLDEEAILRTCLSAVAHGLGFDRTGLYWVDHERREIVGRYLHNAEQVGFSEEGFRQRRVPLGGDDILNKVIATRAAIMVTAPKEEQGVNKEYVQEARTREFVMAPVSGKDRVFGVITADNFHSLRPLEESQKEALMLFASAAGMALDNAVLLSKLGESEARHRTVLDNSPVAILGVSRDNRITTWNRSAEAMFGYPAVEVVGKPLRSLFPPGEEVFGKLMGELVQKGSVREYPLKGVRKNGDSLDLSVSGSGTESDFLQNREWAIVIRDVTMANKLQQQLIFSEKLSAVGTLISGIAHELNNPLQAVVGYAQLLSESQQVTAVDREIKHIYENATRCRKIIDNLLLFVRQGEITKKAAEIRKVIDASVVLLTHKLKRAGKVQVHTQLPDEPIYAKANFQQLEQVLVNLIGNACDALESWTGKREICVRASREGDRVRIEVEDTGPGIPAKVLERIWEPFFTTKAEGKGTGLGLPLCRQIVADHGGQLDVRSTVGQGTVFTIDLEYAEPQVETAVVKPSIAPPKVSGKTILLIEDEAGVRALLLDVLESHGYTVDAVESIAGAIERASNKCFDVVVTDVHLDDGEGPDLFKQWGRYSRHPRPGFLFLTGDILQGDLPKLCNESGMKMMQKPVEIRELLTTVAGLLSDAPASALVVIPTPSARG